MTTVIKLGNIWTQSPVIIKSSWLRLVYLTLDNTIDWEPTMSQSRSSHATKPFFTVRRVTYITVSR